jgi:septin family protein
VTLLHWTVTPVHWQCTNQNCCSQTDSEKLISKSCQAAAAVRQSRYEVQKKGFFVFNKVYLFLQHRDRGRPQQHMSLPMEKTGSPSAPDHPSIHPSDVGTPIETECPKCSKSECKLKLLDSISLNRIMKGKRALHFKLMFVGESGLGKTTAIQCFLHGLATETVIRDTVPIAYQSESGPQPKTIKITEHGPFKLNTDDERQDFLLTIVDTPGYGDNIDVQKDFDLFEDYIKMQWSSLFSAIQAAGNIDTLEHDSLVNACIYFISPHRLKEIDIEFMKRISSTVAIVPVIAKADTMTTEETIQFRKHVHQVLAEQNINVYSWIDCDTGQVDREIQQRKSELHPFPPFTLICAKDCVRRSYLWGDCRLDNEEHSDFLLLKSLLLEKHLLAMKDQAKKTWKCKFYDKHQAYLAAQDQQRAREKSLFLVLLLLLFAAVVFLLLFVIGEALDVKNHSLPYK